MEEKGYAGKGRDVFEPKYLGDETGDDWCDAEPENPHDSGKKQRACGSGRNQEIDHNKN